ncbi:GAF and ANTAR domain-containing protein [Lentzea sp. NBC_00516]|uniref:GAF and ANTAR domain-containing protein n=1 Tax=Lentzea sp. NBC_00516 TaxID=2903582 RepID=UPI002E812691|nr:GAF and ANTAR domain-containing protein [Lentzea sp. NBC_00516]WUD25141.1 GAF and ANTAR domain-containing protein [Lentzea sp. NBC_00516]
MADVIRPFPRSSDQPADDRPDPVERLDETTEALAVLRDALTGEEDLDEALQRLAETAAKAIVDADAVTVSVLKLDQTHTAAATDQLLVEVDEKQYSADRGPCLEAARALTVVRAVVGEHLNEWPEFESAAAAHGIRAYLSVPVVLPASERSEAQHVGSLNIYSRTAAAFDPFDESLMRLFTTAASATITSAQRWQRSRKHIQYLEQALESRAVIEQAKGALMAAYECTADEAFTMLVERSQRENVKLRQVAVTLLKTVTRSGEPGNG